MGMPERQLQNSQLFFFLLVLNMTRKHTQAQKLYTTKVKSVEGFDDRRKEKRERWFRKSSTNKKTLQRYKASKAASKKLAGGKNASW